MAFDPPREVVASTQETVDGDSGTLRLRSDGDRLHLTIDVTAVGTDIDETLDVTVEWSQDDGTTFAASDPADAFTQITQPDGAQTIVKAFDVKAPAYRIVWTLGGTTPDFTFSVSEYVT